MKTYEFLDNVGDEDRLARMNACLDKMNAIMEKVLKRKENTEIENASPRDRRQNIQAL